MNVEEVVAPSDYNYYVTISHISHMYIVPSEHDKVDMLQILTELTMPSDVYEEYSRVNNIPVLGDDRRQVNYPSEERSIPKTTIVVIEGNNYYLQCSASTLLVVVVGIASCRRCK